MSALDAFLSRQLERGRIYFTREEALRVLAPNSLTAALSQLIRKGRIANPRPGFYLILQPEDREQGAPDPARWIHPLMKHQESTTASRFSARRGSTARRQKRRRCS